MTDAAVMTCQEFVELVTDYFERALSAEDRARFEAHIAYCDPCIIYLAELRLTIEAVGYIREEHIAPAANTRLLAEFRAWKQAPGTFASG